MTTSDANAPAKNDDARVSHRHNGRDEKGLVTNLGNDDHGERLKKAMYAPFYLRRGGTICRRHGEGV